MKEQGLFNGLAEKWPSAYVARQEAEHFTGGAISEKYLANLDSRGLGPQGRFRFGRKVVYPVQDFIEWLNGRAEAIPNRTPKA
jgi:hypothetical protein